MGALVGRDDWRVADQWVMNTWVWDQVGLELVQIDVKSTIKTQAGGNRADNLSDEAIKMLVVWSGDIKIATADVIYCFVVNQECTVGVLDSAVGGKNGIVGFNNGSRDQRRWIDGELKLALLAIVGSEALEKQSTEPRSSTTAERVEDQETLERRAVICDTANLIDDDINDLLANSVVTTSIYQLSDMSFFFLPTVYLHVQLFAASSLPLIKSSGWKS